MCLKHVFTVDENKILSRWYHHVASLSIDVAMNMILEIYERVNMKTCKKLTTVVRTRQINQ